jgi:aminoglycoside phosphotransferase (APT) family kinase protein/putative sterol carrier protein
VTAGAGVCYERAVLGRQRDLEATRAALEAWLVARRPGEAFELSSLTSPKAGISNETFLVDVRGRSDVERLVVRVEPTDFLVFPAYDLAAQVRVMQALAGSDVPVPRVRWFEQDPRPLGAPFYVMERIEGEVPSEVPPYHTFGWCVEASPERRARLWWNGIRALAAIHTLDWRARGLDFLGAPASGARVLDAQLDWWQRYLDWVGGPPQPLLTAAVAWLRSERYEPRRVALCWGDARLPNLIFRDDAVAGVLDWEMAFLGDPEADLGWWTFMDWATSEGYGFPRLAGFPGPEETIRGYEEIAGLRVEHPRWQEVFAALRFGIIMARLALRMKEIGAPTPSEHFETDNVATQRLAALLGLPAPGSARPVTRLDDTTVRVQFHLDGPGGGAWYIVARGDQATRADGVVERPDVTVRATAADWEAIQRGELDRTRAFLGGKLRVEGDLSLLMQLEETISRLARREA